MKTFNDYQYDVLPDQSHKGWIYRIYNYNGKILLNESKELFPYEGIARYAAVGHITKLEYSKI